MVKVLRCFNFCSSTILKDVDEEPACLESGGTFVFVGTRGNKIEVFHREKAIKGVNWNRYCTFQTGANVCQIQYSETGDYVATIEKKVNRLTEVVSIKVYLNWHIAATSEQFRTRVRVAGLGYRSTNVETGKRLEVIDIPCEQRAVTMTVCQETGNLGIVFSNVVKLYYLVEKTIPNSQTTFLDVILFLDLQFKHTIERLSLCEDYVTCSSSQFVQVFQINVQDEASGLVTKVTESTHDIASTGSRGRVASVLSSHNTHDKLSSHATTLVKTAVAHIEVSKFSAVGERSSTTPSPALAVNPKVTSCTVEDDADFIHWTFPDQHSAGIKSQHHKSRDCLSIKDPTLTLNGLTYLGKEQRLEPPLPDIKDHRGGNHLTTGRTTLSQLQYQYLDQSDLSWIHIQLIPTYLIGKDKHLKLSGTGNPLCSARRQSLVGMSCLMSGVRTGYMYSLLPAPSLLSTYRYASDAVQVQTNGRLLYVLVENGLEVYTTRCQIAVVHNIEQFNGTENACPQANEDICLCGVQTFLGPRAISVTDKYIILFNKMDNAWNINILEEPSIRDLYYDMVRFGERSHKNAPDIYHHLLLECHMTLKSSLIGGSLSHSEVSVIRDLLHESSALLGDFYSTLDCASWHLCLPYYIMSGLSIIDIVRQAVQHRHHNKQVFKYGQGLVQFLKYSLFLDEDPLDLKQSDGDIVLEVCHDSMPEKLADILLFSRLKTFTPENALKLLKDSAKVRASMDFKSRTKERLAFVTLNLQLCEPDIALSSLSGIDKEDLLQTCLDNPQILLTSTIEFSPLIQLLRCHSPKTLISILILLYDKGYMPMDLALRLLQGRAGVPEMYQNTQIRDYLEVLVGDDCRRFSFDEAVPQLCDIYIQRLKAWEPPSSRRITPSLKFKLPSGSGHFGRRHGWLDNLPPFRGAKSIISTCRYVLPATGRKTGIQSQHVLQCQKIEESCSCFLCNEDLLKLQALLCYSDVSSVVCNKVLSKLVGLEHSIFYNSVAILCLQQTDFERCVRLIVDSHPDITDDFGLSAVKGNAQQWEFILNELISKIQKGLAIETMKDTLKEMAQRLKPEVFIKLLHSDGNLLFFLPYIQLCQLTQKSYILKGNIVSFGENIIQPQNIG